MNIHEIKEIGKIIFGIYSAEEIIKMSVAEINNNKLTGLNSVYDERMGGIDNNKLCITCELDSKSCPGHFGYIRLNEHILHPLYYKTIVNFIKCFCIKCYKILILKEHIELCEFVKFKREKRFNKILEKIEKIDICCNCSHPQPKISHCIQDNSISMTFKENNQKIVEIMSTEEIERMFCNITDEDIILLGFNPELIHPKNLIISVFPVLPPIARPFVLADGNICDDDLTNQILEIVKCNNHLQKDGVNIREDKRQKYLQSLKFRISTFYNNSNGRAKHSTNGRSIKGLKERITGKEGLIRSNLMGKRCEFSGRTVIGPDPTLKMCQLAVPIEIATNMTIPERVTSFNKKWLTDLVNNGKANYILKNNGTTRINLKYALYRKGTELLYGDIIHRGSKKINIYNKNIPLIHGDQIERNSVLLTTVEYPYKKLQVINIGDIVERHLIDGDIVLLNRQPTLHIGSMLAQEVVVRPHKTFRFNLSITKSFNADFDGDEMNIHVPQSLESQAELRVLSMAKSHLVSAQGSKPIIGIFQDSLLGAYRMTREGSNKMSKMNFFDISMKADFPKTGKTVEKLSSDYILKRINHIRKILKQFGKKACCFNGKGLISLILPNSLIYEKKNNANSKEPIVKIYKGVMYEGTLDKVILGQTHNSLIQVLMKEYDENIASCFIDNIQFLSNNWLLMDGFGIGLEDCLLKETSQKNKIDDVISKCLIEAEGIKETTHHIGIREVRINGVLNKARDSGLKIAKESLSNNNNFLSTVNSGSKGDFFNIAQITGLLGQQNLVGRRVQPSLNNGKRTLPHYNFGKLSVEDEYESRGFIKHSFIHGLNPQEFFFHAMSGREGICDTAMGTSKSGYMQRRIVKVCEDIKVMYDGTIRDTTGKIYQNSYGENGYDPCQLVKVNNDLDCCDVGRLVERLNMEQETN